MLVAGATLRADGDCGRSLCPSLSLHSPVPLTERSSQFRSLSIRTQAQLYGVAEITALDSSAAAGLGEGRHRGEQEF